jgi:uncharacterized membrane protein YphA (DoxX/SURF4 family)
LNQQISKMTRARKIVYWAATGSVAFVFFATGVGNLIPLDHIARDMAHLGYPPYVHFILGIWKILGAVVIILPRLSRLTEWAYAGMIFDLTGASMSRLASGDGVDTIIIPLLITCLVLTSSLLRSQDKFVISGRTD